MILIMANKHNSLSHTKWLCKYHIVFTPKYRRKIEFNQYKRDIVDLKSFHKANLDVKKPLRLLVIIYTFLKFRTFGSAPFYLLYNRIV